MIRWSGPVRADLKIVIGRARPYRVLEEKCNGLGRSGRRSLKNGPTRAVKIRKCNGPGRAAAQHSEFDRLG